MAVAELSDLLSAGVEPCLRLRQGRLQERLPDEDEELQHGLVAFSSGFR